MGLRFVLFLATITTSVLLGMKPEEPKQFTDFDYQMEMHLGECCESLDSLLNFDARSGPFDFHSIAQSGIFSFPHQGRAPVIFHAGTAEVMNFWIENGFSDSNALVALIDKHIPADVIAVLLEKFPGLINKQVSVPNNEQIIQYFWENGVTDEEIENHYFYGRPQTKKIRNLVWSFPDNYQYRYPLQLAVASGRPDLVRMVLKAGAYWLPGLHTTVYEIMDLLAMAEQTWKKAHMKWAMLRQLVRTLRGSLGSGAILDAFGMTEVYACKTVFDLEADGYDLKAVEEYSALMKKI